jgi:predicted HTH transcriptional regulator
MDGHADETGHIISLCKFENKRYKEQILHEVIAAICAMLNSSGGKVVIDIDTGHNDIPMESSRFSQISSVIRILEQSMTSIIGFHQTNSKINFKEDKDRIVIFVKQMDSLITTRFNLYLPSDKQVVQVSPLELENVKDNIINRKVVLEPVERGSHCEMFLKGKNCGFHETKCIQLKLLQAAASKRTSLADRMIRKGNKFSCYVSAFANYNGGHIYYGITDDGIVEGELTPNETADKREITNKVKQVINEMIWPKQIVQPKRGKHWEIFFEPVIDKYFNAVPSTFVIVIYIAPCLGGVFTEEPECYKMMEGDVKKMSFTTWIMQTCSPRNNYTGCIKKVTHI